MALFDDLKKYLTDNGISSAIVFGYNAESPDKIIALIDTGGDPANVVLSDIIATYQILARDTTVVNAETLAWQIFNLFDKPESRVLVANGRKMSVKAMQPPHHLLNDNKNRVVYVFNIEILTTRD